MKKRIIISLIVACFIVQGSYAQMDINSANYFINPFVLNPAFTGKFKPQSVMLDVRKDASGIDGSPTSQYVTYDWGVVPEKIGVGLMFKNDVEGLLRHHIGYLNFSYRAKIEEDHYFDLGLNAGLVYRGINFNDVRAKHAQESTLNVENSYSSAFDGGAGVLYYFKGIEAGVSLSHISQPRFSFSNVIDQSTLSSTLTRNTRVTLAYNWGVNEDYKVKPLVVLNSNHGLPVNFEGGVAGYWKETLWLGVIYKHDLGVNIVAGTELYDRFSFAYSYHYYTGSLNQVTRGAHEVIVGLRLGKAKSPEENQKFLELERQNAEMYEQLEILKQQNEARKKEIDDLKQGYSQNEKDSMKAIIAGLKELHDHLDDHKDKIENEKDNHATDLNNVHESTEEVDAKYRVIIGSFNEMGHAQSMQKIIQREYGIGTQIMKNEATGRFLIYSKECLHREDCKGEMDKIRQINSKEVIKGNPWLYKAN